MNIQPIRKTVYFNNKCSLAFHKNNNSNCTYFNNSINYYSISFGYKSVLKTEWIRGHLPSVKRGFYGGKLTKKNVTLEHIVPHSKGGKTNLWNLALSVDVENHERSNRPLREFFDPETFQEYIEQFREVNLPNLKGLQYIERIIKLVKRVLKNEGYDISKISYFN